MSNNDQTAVETTKPLKIQVEGSGSSYRTAERSVLTLRALTKSWPTAQEAESNVAFIANSLCDAIAPYCASADIMEDKKNEAAISQYTLRFFETSKSHERDSESSYSSFKSSSFKSAFTGSAELVIELRDFALLARLVAQFRSMANVDVQSVQWILTPSSQAEIESEARKKAARQAMRKARDYAEGLGGLSEEEAKSRVRAVLVKEHVQQQTIIRPKAQHGKIGSGPVQKSAWDFAPRELGVGIKIDAQFVVDE